MGARLITKSPERCQLGDKNQLFKFSPNALGSNFDIDVKLVKVNLDSLFEQTW